MILRRLSYLSVLLLGLLFVACDSDEENLKLNHFPSGSAEEFESDQSEDDIKKDSISAEEAVKAYHSSLRAYAKALDNGNEKLAADYRGNMENINSFMKKNYSNQRKLLQNMNEMNQSVMEMQKQYIEGTFQITEELLETMKGYPGSQEVQDAMDETSKEMQKAMEETQQEMNDAMQEIEDAMEGYGN